MSAPLPRMIAEVGAKVVGPYGMTHYQPESWRVAGVYAAGDQPDETGTVLLQAARDAFVYDATLEEFARAFRRA